GTNTSDVLFNYQDIDTQDGSAFGQHASVGIKDAGNQSATNDVLEVSFRQASPFVVNGKAIKFSAPPFGATVSGNVYNDLNHNGTLDPGEPGLQGWTVFEDLNNNGVLDPGEPSAVTDAGGNYTLAGVFPGTVRLREVPQSGWVRSQPGAPGAYVFNVG